MKRDDPVLPVDLLVRLAVRQTPRYPEQAVAVRLRACILERASQRCGDVAYPPGPKAEGELFTLRSGEGEWMTLAPKVAMKLLRRDAHSRTFLMRLDPGAVLPPHDHPLEEECYVLEGEVRFGDLAVGAGDYHLAPKGLPHGAVRSRSGALLLLRGANP